MTETVENQYYPIPAWVFSIKELELPSEKLTLGFICSLAGLKGYCYASNAYIGELVGISPQRVSKIVTKLKRCKLISCEMIYKDGSKEVEQRRVYVTKPMVTQDITPSTTVHTPRSHSTSPLVPHDQVITKSINKTINKVNTGNTHKLDEHLIQPDGTQNWEKLNQYIIGLRKPMKKYPQLMISPWELEEVIQSLEESGIQPEKFHLVFKPAALQAKQQIIAGKSQDMINCVGWLTGFCKANALEELKKQNYFDKSRGV